MPKPKNVELPNGVVIPILYEDASTLAIDKPAGWMCAPTNWQSTGRNLQAALESSVNHRDYWAHSRNINFLRFVHRLDADTSGVLLLAKSAGAMKALSELFQSRAVEKIYLAVVVGEVDEDRWICELPIGQVKGRRGVMKIDETEEGDALTEFRTLQRRAGFSLVEARPLTGRTHQIRLHLKASGHPVLNDPIYGKGEPEKQTLALRAIQVSYVEPFRKKPVVVRARVAKFIGAHGFEVKQAEKIRGSD